jgi:hypothetical protein
MSEPIFDTAFSNRLKQFLLTGKTLGPMKYSSADIQAEMAPIDAILEAGLSSIHMLGSLTYPIASSLVATGANAVNFAGATPATEVNGSLVTTISTWVPHTAAGACAGKILAKSTAVTGQFATWRMRGRSDAAVADVYNVASVEGVNSSASANVNDYANLFGISGLAQPNAFTQANATNIICGVYSCMDRTGTHAGHAYSMWIDDHSTTAKAADHYLLRMTQNALGGSPVNIDGAISIAPTRLPALLKFDSVTGFLSTSGTGTFTKTHKLAVKIDGDATAYYIEMGTII